MQIEVPLARLFQEGGGELAELGAGLGGAPGAVDDEDVVVVRVEVGGGEGGGVHEEDDALQGVDRAAGEVGGEEVATRAVVGGQLAEVCSGGWKFRSGWFLIAF